MLRQSLAITGLVLLGLLTGCGSLRSNRAGTPTVKPASIVQTKVGANQLVGIADLLREQGQHAQAAEMYRLALKRDPRKQAREAGNEQVAARSALP